MVDYISPSLIIVGSVCFFIAASILGSIYTETYIELIVETINQNRSAFIFGQVLFGLGGLVTAIGFLLYSMTNSEKYTGNLSIISSGFLIIGSIMWIIHLILRTMNPEEHFITSAVPLFELKLNTAIPLIYILFTIIGLSGFAVVFYNLNYPVIVPGILILISFISIILIIFIGGAFPPVFYYIFTFFIGIYMIVRQYNLS